MLFFRSLERCRFHHERAFQLGIVFWVEFVPFLSIRSNAKYRGRNSWMGLFKGKSCIRGFYVIPVVIRVIDECYQSIRSCQLFVIKLFRVCEQSTL